MSWGSGDCNAEIVVLCYLSKNFVLCVTWDNLYVYKCVCVYILHIQDDQKVSVYLITIQKSGAQRLFDHPFHTHTHTHSHAYIHSTHTHTLTHTHTYTHTHKHTYTHMHTRMHAYIHEYIHTYTHMHARACIYTYICLILYICIFYLTIFIYDVSLEVALPV